ncbi:hypothetical protein GEMMAAP_10910 [Gemmatimonas phototrophica]|uniref:Uncharacterized protein n=2 Tax=Gemmatimonas phototrophica TaxID=1379270 RepID=A0A143BJE7_9BACT|nr:hypothetical protein GEMMAAP_10910 [Gemmatimonas phototrophica]
MSVDVHEVTELAGYQTVFRQLIQKSVEERRGSMDMGFDFHRGWNGGWRCRVTAPSGAALDFALLLLEGVTPVAVPVPMPQGWRSRGVAAADGRRLTSTSDGALELISTP